MKLKLLAMKNGAVLFEGVYTVMDARSFGEACADLWVKLAERNVATETSVGALYEALGDRMIPDLDAVQLRFERQHDP